MSRTAPNINRLWADLIVDELIRNGVTRFFVAPGSRSSPLIAAVALNPRAEATIHFDERGAAFAALGFGRATGLPAVWITTSGTAAANGLPAVVEAAQSSVPLIAVTADRPPELRDAGANQAIDQVRLFGTYPRWFFDLPCPSAEIETAFVLTTVDQAVHRSLDLAAGPVHLNCPFREPLAPSEQKYDVPTVPARWASGDASFTQYRTGVLQPDPTTCGELKARFSGCGRGLVVVGELPNIDDAIAVSTLADRLGWPIVADVTSQLRLGDSSRFVVRSPHFACAALADDSRPELILRLGGPVSSKDVQRYIEASSTPIVSVTDQPQRRDPGHNLSEVIRSSTRAFCEALRDVESVADEPWVNRWISVGERIRSSLRDRLALETKVSEPGVSMAVTHLLPENHALFVASSMPIRDVDMFGHSTGSLRRVSANRGASGIDGTVASAFGFHLGAKSPVTLLIGDLALLHDLNSLALLRDRPIVVVVINNRGGGIYNFLPIAEHPAVFEPWFTAPHDWSFENAAAMFGLRYERPDTIASFEQRYSEAVSSGEAYLIEIVTERDQNRSYHNDLRTAALRAAKME